MVEFFPDPTGEWDRIDPRMRPEWPAFRDDYWPGHPLGLRRLSHVTVVVHDLAAAEKFYVELLDAVPLPDQVASVAGAVSRYVVVGEDTIVELLSPSDPSSRAARDLAEVGESVVGVTFTVSDILTAQRYLASPELPAMSATEHDIVFDTARTWGCEYRLTDRVLTGDPRV
jgi:hypothetical protein